MANKGIRAFLHNLEYAGLIISHFICRLLPFKTCMKMVDFLSPVISFLFPIRKGIVLQNLERAFPGESKESRMKILRKTYRNFLLFLIEFIHFGKMRSGDLSRQIVEIEGSEYIKEAGVGEKPFLIVTGHLGNWELMGAYFASKGYRFSVLAKPIHNEKINEFVNRMREEKGINVISTREFPLKYLYKTVKEGNGLVFLADQDARRAGIFIDFFGTPASTFTGPAVFSLRTGLPLLPVFVIRKNLVTHKVIFHPPIYPPQGDREEATRIMMQDYTRVLEQMIRKYPEQYFWFHRRWKSKPRRKDNP
jgi:KDO2-lipid IV(A) lauroyltransferase